MGMLISHFADLVQTLLFSYRTCQTTLILTKKGAQNGALFQAVDAVSPFRVGKPTIRVLMNAQSLQRLARPFVAGFLEISSPRYVSNDC